jgi:hypothetical protein
MSKLKNKRRIKDKRKSWARTVTRSHLDSTPVPGKKCESSKIERGLAKAGMVKKSGDFATSSSPLGLVSTRALSPLVSAQLIVFTDQSHCRFRFWDVTLPSEMANQIPAEVLLIRASDVVAALLPANHVDQDILAALQQVRSPGANAQVVNLVEAAAQSIAQEQGTTPAHAMNLFTNFLQNPDIDALLVQFLHTDQVDLEAHQDDFNQLVDVEGGQQTLDGTWAADAAPPDDEGEEFFEPEDQEVFEAQQQTGYQQNFNNFQDMHPAFPTQAAALQAWHAWLGGPAL